MLTHILTSLESSICVRNQHSFDSYYYMLISFNDPGGAFWKAPLSGTDSQGGTIVHESTHFTANAGTDDYAYGQSDCKSLAKSNTAHAIENADSHEVCGFYYLNISYWVC